MKIFLKQMMRICLLGLLSIGGSASAQDAQETPEALVRRISRDVQDGVKADAAIQKGDQQRGLALIEAKILPSINFQRMTAMAAGSHWQTATPEQQQKLTDAFRTLLVHTYSGAIAQVKDKKFEFTPAAGKPEDTEAIIRSRAAQARGEALQINYRLEKISSGWKICDVNIMGVWLVETYKNNFSSEIGKSGIDGLIKALEEKNAKASGPH